MKLSKKNRVRQRAIAKAIASGKALGGLLAGFTVAAFAGCSYDSHSGPVGRFPAALGSTPQNQRKRSGYLSTIYLQSLEVICSK